MAILLNESKVKCQHGENEREKFVFYAIFIFFSLADNYWKHFALTANKNKSQKSHLIIAEYFSKIKFFCTFLVKF